MAENLKRQDGLPPAMTRLVKELSRLPGIGEKTASRLAFNLLNRPRDQVIALAESLLEMKERVGLCSGCFGLSDHPRCQICDDEAREREVICVVEGPADLMAIERARSFGGVYHVLNGALAPLDGIGPDDIKMKELIARVSPPAVVREVIIATNATVEGEAT
ncbi:MAG TPA: recombination mediator RecR, partial [Candidatus Binatus sp.]|nr:recombination mediator RecR [Candidatus Binatus sp.]